MLALALATPAYAQTVTINQDHVPTTAEDFATHECTEPFEDLPEDTDGWHFVLPDASGDSFLTLTLTYDGAEVTITSTDPDNPSEGPGWSGYFAFAGDDAKHAYVFTESGWTLTDGTAVVNNPGGQDFFNLSHTCPGTPAGEPTPTPEPTPSASPTPGATTSPTAGPTMHPVNGPMLPITGLPVVGLVIAGAGMLATGTVLLARRRQD